MKKILILLLLCTFVAPIFADDALVLPKGVMRFYVVPTYSMADSEYDADGEKVDMDSVKLMTVGAAVEYGVTDWISAAVQWTPGWGVWSDLETDENAKLSGPFDVFAGAKVQIIGPKAPVANESMRLCLAPGVKIPLPGADFEEEATAYGSGEEYTPQNLDKHVLGLGGRAYFDYLVTKDIFVNLYGELIYYPTAATFEDASMLNWITVATLKAMTMPYPKEINYGYDLTLEVEPAFWPWVAEGMQLKIGVPVTYVASPETEVDGTGQDDASYVLSVAPSVALFTTVLPMPIEVKASYSLPLMGENANATSTFIVQLKGFLKF
jgi:hypothetical protein